MNFILYWLLIGCAFAILSTVTERHPVQDYEITPILRAVQIILGPICFILTLYFIIKLNFDNENDS